MDSDKRAKTCTERAVDAVKQTRLGKPNVGGPRSMMGDMLVKPVGAGVSEFVRCATEKTHK